LANIIGVESMSTGPMNVPMRKQVNMADYKDHGDEEVEIEELNTSDFVKKKEDFVACVVQRLQCNQKSPNTTQRYQIFYSRCSVKNNICNLINDKRKLREHHV